MFSKNNNNQENPFSKIQLSFEISCDLKKGRIFCFHFQIPQDQLDVMNAANQLLDFLLPSTPAKGLFSYESKRQKFPNEVGVKRKYTRDHYYGYYNVDKPLSVFNNLQGSGKATIYIELPRNESWNDGHYAFLFTLSLLDDGINCMKRLGCEIDFSLLEVMNTLDEVYTKSKDLFVTPKGIKDPDTNPETLSLLLKLVKEYPTIIPLDAILLAYCLEAIDRFNIVRHKGKRIEYPVINDMKDILKIIDTCAYEMVMSDVLGKRYQLEEYIDEFLERLDQCRRIKLFSKTLGEKRTDGVIYSWFSPEWAFLRDTKFVLVAPEKMVIYPGKVKEGFYGPPLEFGCRELISGCSANYSKGQPYHSEFFNHLKELELHGNMGFSFDHTSDVFDAIKLTKDCSIYYTQLQLEVDKSVIKNAFRTKNNHRFFQQKNTLGLLSLPEELLEMISPLVHFKVEKTNKIYYTEVLRPIVQQYGY